MTKTSSKIFYMEDSLGSYLDYGIGVPLKDERVTKILDNFKDNPSLERRRLTKFKLSDLLLAHTDRFYMRAVGDSTNLVLQAYELINDDGSFHRYEPDSAKRPLKDFIMRALAHCEGTYLAAENALESGFSYHLGGGMHHAKSSEPGGFCLFNDIVIAIRKLQKEKGLGKCLVIDMDAHKGDGTAEILKDDKTIDCLSIHMKDGWPLDNPDKTNSSFIPSTWDIPVTADDNYLEKLEKVKDLISDKYDLCIVVQGADVYEKDILESAKGIQLSLEECLKRDLFMKNFLEERKIPQAWVMAGGYGDEVYRVFLQFLQNTFKN
ncbi:hypothetical protein [Halobacteriovorax sp. DPLXC-1]|uniref:hypothetical protein n=1 Tax=Halobacteriovorax sp. DPLXC-1 TaxID=3110771 RepID=UPI002FF3AAD3